MDSRDTLSTAAESTMYRKKPTPKMDSSDTAHNVSDSQAAGFADDFRGFQGSGKGATLAVVTADTAVESPKSAAKPTPKREKAQSARQSTHPIVLFGGSFDPPHLGHLEIIKRLDSSYKRVIVIPAFCNPFKSMPIAPIHTRIAWLEELCADYLRVEISDFEARANRVVYAIEYVCHYASKYGEIGLALGSDALESLPRWKEASELAQLAKIVPLVRDFGACETTQTSSSQTEIATQTQKLEKVGSRYSTTKPLHITGFPISSTHIRAALARGDFAQVAHWIPPSIAPSVRKIYYNTP